MHDWLARLQAIEKDRENMNKNISCGIFAVSIFRWYCRWCLMFMISSDTCGQIYVHYMDGMEYTWKLWFLDRRPTHPRLALTSIWNCLGVIWDVHGRHVHSVMFTGLCNSEGHPKLYNSLICFTAVWVWCFVQALLDNAVDGTSSARFPKKETAQGKKFNYATWQFGTTSRYHLHRRKGYGCITALQYCGLKVTIVGELW